MLLNQLQHLPDNHLVIKYQQEKEVAAFEALYERYADRVFQYCYRIIGQREDAQDIAIEVFERVFENIGKLKEAVTFQAWLFRIARNKSINACVKRQNKFFISIDDMHELIDEDSDFEQQEQLNAKVVKMEAAVQALPAATKTLLMEKYYEKESIESLMQRYHLSESAVKMRLARARRKASGLFSRAG